MRIAIVGGSAGGLFAALTLVRAGHQVLLLEQDVLQPGSDVESAAASAFRSTAPHIVSAARFRHTPHGSMRSTRSARCS